MADDDGATDCSCNEPEAQWNDDKIGIPTTFLMGELWTTKYEHSATQTFLENGRFRPRPISLVFWCPYFESSFPTVDFQKSEVLIDLSGGSEPIRCAVDFSFRPLTGQ